jgi:hypothetical protein
MSFWARATDRMNAQWQLNPFWKNSAWGFSKRIHINHLAFFWFVVLVCEPLLFRGDNGREIGVGLCKPFLFASHTESAILPLWNRLRLRSFGAGRAELALVQPSAAIFSSQLPTRIEIVT